ncbi:MAG: flippase-like domain-containing protein [Actinobacteria bacterium]|nr:flippase-like domain-containing protein [Actinomycetota bacterium]
MGARRRPRWGAWVAAAAVTAVTLVVVARSVDGAALETAARAAVVHPLTLTAVLAAYAAAFVVRAAVWRRVVPQLRFGQALAALHVSLAGNHVLPLRLGEPLRVASVVRRAGVPLRPAAASVVTLRAADLLTVGSLAVALGAPVAGRVVGAGAGGVLVLAAAGVAAGTWWLRRTHGSARTRPPGPAVALGTVVSWLLEAAVVWQAARWAGAALSIREAVLVTAVTIAAQVVAVAPGGFGTYEAAAATTLVALGLPAGTALAVALVAHAVKTVYALAAGAVALVVPAPGMLGRLRLERHRPRRRQPAPAAERQRPVVLFLPAHDEEATVAGVVARAPSSVRGHPVEVVVVDDGSTDATAERAAAAGAAVVRFAANRGLGAAVRRGLAEAVDRDAAAVAFCDADGEYAPEELEALVAPILDATADYVVGTRFGGRIQRMLPHRRVGNLVLTALLRIVSRHPVSDGQSGYRALSPAAAAAAEIVHDFNYAQVLTLDLLAKGYRYAEVPISYRFRETGESFVRLGRYVRAVVPAVYRELNAA